MSLKHPADATGLRRRLAALALLAGAALLLGGCSHMPLHSSQAGTSSGNGKAPPSALAGLSEQDRQAYRQAVNLMQQGQLAQANQAFAQLTRAHPKLALAWFNLGLTRAKQQQTPAAIKALKHGLSLRPDNVQALNQLGIEYRRSGDFDSARQAYLKALKINPHAATAHYNLGILYDLYLRQPQKALAQYRAYQADASQPDKKTKLWIADLQRRIKNSQP